MTCADCPGGTDFEQRAAELQAQIERVSALAERWEQEVAQNREENVPDWNAGTVRLNDARDLRAVLAAPTEEENERAYAPVRAWLDDAAPTGREEQWPGRGDPSRLGDGT